MSQRIIIVGNSGSGKSTLAKALAKELDIPVFHLDRELLHGNFEKHPIEIRTELHQRLIDNESWVIDGNYEKLLEYRVQRATLAIFLNTSRFTTIPRVIQRARKDGQPTDVIPDGARGKNLSWQFLEWVVRYNRKKKAAYLEGLCRTYSVPVVKLPNISTDEQIKRVKQLLHS